MFDKKHASYQVEYPPKGFVFSTLDHHANNPAIIDLRPRPARSPRRVGASAPMLPHSFATS
jgi:hypothetical protein